MLEALQQKKTGVRIMLAVVVTLLGLAMVITLIPGTIDPVVGDADAVAEVAGQPITVAEVRQQMQRIAGGRDLPPALEGLYARQVIDGMVNERLFEAEAKRLGILVTRQEQAERIRRMLPSAQAGQMDLYAQEVFERTGMSVPEFEQAIRRSMIQERLVLLATDGIRVAPEEVLEEFRRRTEKVKLEYLIVKPEDLESSIQAGDAELTAYFEKNKAKYQVPERRSLRYAVLGPEQVRARLNVTDADLKSYYNEHIDRFQVQDRAKVSRIVFKTRGKTDAEVAEIRKRAEDVLKKARGKAMFEDLAKQYSEDESTKAKGGDLGWILRGQTEPAFENAAFSLAVGSVSDLVKSDVGFEIIKLVQREKARTRTLDEVRATILTEVTEQKASQAAADLSDRIGQALRQNTRRSLEDLAKEFGLRLGQAPAAGVQEPVGEFGMVPELSSALFALRPGELAGPVRAGFSHVVLSLKDVVPAHQGTLAEVRSTVLLDYRREKAGELAKVRAEELAARAKSPANLAAVAKPLKLEVKTSEPTNVSGTLPEIGSLRPLSAAFSLAAGQAGPATAVGANWIVYRVVSREGPKPEDVTREMREAESQALQAKRQVAVAAFQEALRERMVREGKLRFNPENLRRLTGPSLP